MRYAIITDIHANLPALRAVLQSIAQSDIGKLICLGDIVGYGAWPAECVQTIRAIDCPVVMGNHDSYLTAPDDDFLRVEKTAAGRKNQVFAGIRHARQQVKGDDLAWLAERPRLWESGNLVFGHAALHGDDPDDWPYLISAEEAEPTLALLGKRIGFFGHSHREKAFCGGKESFVKKSAGVYRFPPACRPAAITVGSVGQPRTGDPRAHWAIWDSGSGTYFSKRTPYPVAEAALGILDAGLPADAALRLYGRSQIDEVVLERLIRLDDD
jgi:predicted phosphodiesterase